MITRPSRYATIVIAELHSVTTNKCSINKFYTIIANSLLNHNNFLQKINPVIPS